MSAVHQYAGPLEPKPSRSKTAALHDELSGLCQLQGNATAYAVLLQARGAGQHNYWQPVGQSYLSQSHSLADMQLSPQGCQVKDGHSPAQQCCRARYAG